MLGALNRSSASVDYLIVGIPPLETVPTSIYQANGNSGDLAFLGELASNYNSQVAAIAQQLASEFQKHGRVYFYDLANLVCVVCCTGLDKLDKSLIKLC